MHSAERPVCRSTLGIFLCRPGLESFLERFFVTGIGRGVIAPVTEFFRQVLLVDNLLFVIVGVLVIFTVAEIAHQRCRGVAEMKWNREGAVFLNVFAGGKHGFV